MAPAAPETPRLHRLADRIEAFEVLEAPAGRLAGAVHKVVKPGPLKDVLSGSWLGHPLHPVLTDVALAAWISAALLDVWPGEGNEPAADRLVAAGIGAAVPTAASGLSDWADTTGGSRRIGLVHATANATALTLYTASYALRRRGRRALGVGVGFAGATAVLVGAFLGGHLSYSRGIGVNRTAFEPPLLEWTPVLDGAELVEGRPTRASSDGVDLLLLRRGGDVFAISNRCTHRGGHLHEGELDGLTVTCPLHGSRFRMSDGAVARGPAAVPQPAYEARIRDGTVEVRLQAGMRGRV